MLHTLSAWLNIYLYTATYLGGISCASAKNVLLNGNATRTPRVIECEVHRIKFSLHPVASKIYTITTTWPSSIWIVSLKTEFNWRALWRLSTQQFAIWLWTTFNVFSMPISPFLKQYHARVRKPLNNFSLSIHIITTHNVADNGIHIRQLASKLKMSLSLLL